ncbi:hypothetical protein D9M73_231700 [compost metagenome]
MSCIPTAKITAMTIPPIKPSIVFLGEISGHNLFFPNFLPTKYAPESVVQTTNKQ